MSFSGFTADTFKFLMEIRFNNNVEWFDANRERYKRSVQLPLKQLATELIPTVLSVDPNFSTNLNTTVSRIRRDTRFTKDKSPYRDNMWLGYRYPNKSISEGFTIWFGIDTSGYDYGMGFFYAEPGFMSLYRKRIISDPAGFFALAEPLLKHGFMYSCEAYKRDRFPDVPAEIKPYINVKNFSWMRHFDGVADLLEPSDIANRLKDEFILMKPMYDYVRSIAFIDDASKQSH